MIALGKQLMATNISSPKSRHISTRLHKDVQELQEHRFTAGRTITKLCFPSGFKDLGDFSCTICPLEGPYSGGSFEFKFIVPPKYPFHPPIVRCTSQVFHPNIYNGAVSLPLISRPEWKPTLSINTVILGLQLLFLEPNLDGVINVECARLLTEDRKRFYELVRATIARNEVHPRKRRGSAPVLCSKRMRISPSASPHSSSKVQLKRFKRVRPDDSGGHLCKRKKMVETARVLFEPPEELTVSNFTKKRRQNQKTAVIRCHGGRGNLYVSPSGDVMVD